MPDRVSRVVLPSLATVCLVLSLLAFDGTVARGISAVAYGLLIYYIAWRNDR